MFRGKEYQMKGGTEDAIEHLREMDEYQFEEFIAEMWEAQGWETSVSQKSNDSGVDIVAKKEQPYAQTTYIQAKRYGPGTSVGVREVREYASLYNRDNVDAVIIVTTGGYTQQAEEEAESHNVKLIGPTDLSDIIIDLGVEDLLRSYTDFRSVNQVGIEEVDSGDRQTSDSDREKDHPFGDIPNPSQEIKLLYGYVCQECYQKNTIWQTTTLNTGTRWKCEYCNTVWRDWQNRNFTKLPGAEDAHDLSKTTEDENDLRELAEEGNTQVDDEVYNNKAWTRTQISFIIMVIMPILLFITLAFFPQTENIIAILGGLLTLAFMTLWFGGLVLFSIFCSRDKRALNEVTPAANPRHPITLAILLLLTYGFYSVFYVIRRSTKYSIKESHEDGQ